MIAFFVFVIDGVRGKGDVSFLCPEPLKCRVEHSVGRAEVEAVAVGIEVKAVTVGIEVKAAAVGCDSSGM